MNDIYYVCAPTPLQFGAEAGFALPQSHYDDLRRSYLSKRDMLCAALNDVGLTPIVPQGAYYVMADATVLGREMARDAAMALLERTKVASIPGSAFYRAGGGEKLLRFCFAKEDEVLKEACKKLRALKASS